MTEDEAVDPENVITTRKRGAKVAEKETTITTPNVTNGTTGEYAFQISTKINGDLVNLRANSAEEFEQQLAEFAERGIAKKWSDFKQAAVAEIIFTNDDRRPASKSTSTATDDAPSGSGSGIPSCKHGEMKDLGDKYKSGRYHCPLDTRDLGPDGWKEKCKPVK